MINAAGPKKRRPKLLYTNTFHGLPVLCSLADRPAGGIPSRTDWPARRTRLIPSAQGRAYGNFRVRLCGSVAK